jgi:hypothetical protein
MIRPYRTAAAALALVLMGTTASAQSYIQPPCPAGPTPKFEDPLQSLWYRRFWTGDCKHLPALSCRPGRPNWNDVVRTLSAPAPTDQRHDVSVRLCRLGARIGFEWTRPKSERRIDSQDLKAFNDKLSGAPDVSTGVAAVEGAVRGKIGS